MNRWNSDDWMHITLMVLIIVWGACHVAQIAREPKEPNRFFVIIDGKLVEMEEKKEWSCDRK